MSDLVDRRGCLTAAGRAALRDAPVGQAPADLAQHVAGCSRCQARLLAADIDFAGAPSAAPGAGARGRLWRPVLFIVAALLFALGALALATLVRSG